MSQPNCGFKGCYRLAGHKGPCVGLPEEAIKWDEADRKTREAAQHAREHPVQSFDDITRCSTCYALIFKDDEELHWSYVHSTPE